MAFENVERYVEIAPGVRVRNIGEWVLFAGHFKTRGGSFLKIEVVENAACNRRLILMLARLSSDLSIHGRCETRLGREVVVWIEPICLKNNDGLDRCEMDFLRSEEHTSELQSLMRISYAVFCLKKKTLTQLTNTNHHKLLST